MNLKKEFVRFPKDVIYEMYISIVYNYKEYENITRSKMIDEIIKEYSQPNYLYNICTEKELKFLKYARNKKISKEDIIKYEWEINELNKKGIFSKVEFDVFIEQKANVESALEFYNNHISYKKSDDELIIFMISVIKVNADMLTKTFMTMISSIFNIKKEYIDKFFGNPLFHFYCEFSSRYFEFSDNYEEIISFRDYYPVLDILFEARKEFGIAGSKKYDIRDYYDIFYYDFPIKNKKVKTMYDVIKELPYKNFYFSLISDARILNDREKLNMFIENDELLNIINIALDEIPCAAMNGFTPREYKEEKIKQVNIERKFSLIPQNNAHLCKNEADQFYKLYFGLLEYINRKYKISPSIDKIYKQESLNVYDLKPIDEYLWKNKKIIDEFIEENPHNFVKEELEIINGFKTAVTDNCFVIVGFEREYTEILSNDGKIYMVKGIRSDIDSIIDAKNIPAIVSTTLLMFNGKIIFNSFFLTNEIVFGNDIKESILSEYDKAIRFYHL